VRSAAACAAGREQVELFGRIASGFQRCKGGEEAADKFFQACRELVIHGGTLPWGGGQILGDPSLFFKFIGVNRRTLPRKLQTRVGRRSISEGEAQESKRVALGIAFGEGGECTSPALTIFVS